MAINQAMDRDSRAPGLSVRVEHGYPSMSRWWAMCLVVPIVAGITTHGRDACAMTTVNVRTYRSDELVGVGDTVMLSLSAYSKAARRVVAKTDDGQVQCLLNGCQSRQPGGMLNVHEDQLPAQVHWQQQSPRLP